MVAAYPGQAIALGKYPMLLRGWQSVCLRPSDLQAFFPLSEAFEWLETEPHLHPSLPFIPSANALSAFCAILVWLSTHALFEKRMGARDLLC